MGAAKEIYGIPIPQPKPGYNRASDVKNTVIWTPLGSNGDIAQGARQLFYVEMKPAPLLYNLAMVLPKFVQKRSLQKKIETETKEFARFLRNSKVLTERIRTGPRAPLYETIHRHLIEKN